MSEQPSANTVAEAAQLEYEALRKELNGLRKMLSAIQVVAATEAEGDGLLVHIRQLRMRANLAAQPSEPGGNVAVMWARDLDGTGSWHPCVEDDPGAVEFHSAQRLTKAAALCPTCKGHQTSTDAGNRPCKTCSGTGYSPTKPGSGDGT